VRRQRKTTKNTGVFHKLDPSDPRSPDHPSHDEQWDELAKAIGRRMAREQYARDHQGGNNADDEAADRSDLRSILK
jgi:hypothetical protein